MAKIFRGSNITYGNDANFQCVNNFLDNSSNFVLFLDSDAILEDPNTLTRSVVQDLPVISPLLMTNEVRAKKRQKCDFGWNRTTDMTVSFPDEHNRYLVKAPRTLVSSLGTYSK